MTSQAFPLELVAWNGTGENIDTTGKLQSGGRLRVTRGSCYGNAMPIVVDIQSYVYMIMCRDMQAHDQ